MPKPPPQAAPQSSPAAGSAEEIALLVRSGWCLIALETFEEERALEMLAAAARECGREVVTWSVASGMASTGQGAGSLDAGLRALATRPEPALFALLDAHRHTSDALGMRQMRDILPTNAGKRCAINRFRFRATIPWSTVRAQERAAPRPVCGTGKSPIVGPMAGAAASLVGG